MIWAEAVMIWAGVVMIWAGACSNTNFPTLKMPKNETKLYTRLLLSRAIGQGQL